MIEGIQVEIVDLSCYRNGVALRSGRRGARALPASGIALRTQTSRRRRGGIGYLLKERVADAGELADAVLRVGNGGSAIDPLVVEQMVGRKRSKTTLDRLSPRELEVLRLMAQGRSNAALAARLFLTPKTVESHVTSIFTKLDLLPEPESHRRVLAVLTYLHTGQAEPD